MAGGVIVKDESLSLAAKLVWAAKTGGISFYYFPLICPPAVIARGNEMDQEKRKRFKESVRQQSSRRERLKQ